MPLQRAPRNTQLPGKRSLRAPRLQLPADVRPLACELVPLRLLSLHSPEPLALLPRPRKPQLRPLREQLPLDLRTKPESERQHLALDVVAQLVAFLDGNNTHMLLKEKLEHIEDHYHGAPQPGELCNYYHVILLDRGKQPAQLALLRLLCAGYGLGHPLYIVKPALPAVSPDGHLLILDGLLLGADSEISV